MELNEIINKQRLFTEGEIIYPFIDDLLEEGERIFVSTDFGWLFIEKDIAKKIMHNDCLKHNYNFMIYFLISDAKNLYISKNKIKYDNDTP